MPSNSSLQNDADRISRQARDSDIQQLARIVSELAGRVEETQAKAEEAARRARAAEAEAAALKKKLG